MMQVFNSNIKKQNKFSHQKLEINMKSIHVEILVTQPLHSGRIWHKVNF